MNANRATSTPKRAEDEAEDRGDDHVRRAGRHRGRAVLAVAGLLSVGRLLAVLGAVGGAGRTALAVLGLAVRGCCPYCGWPYWGWPYWAARTGLLSVLRLAVLGLPWP